jgi:hypothetical protein
MDAPLRKIVLRGGARERGRNHGETLRELVREHLERWQEALRADVGAEPEEYVEEILRETNFFPAAERWTPDLLEELRGIAEGAGTDFRYTFVRALSDEEPWYRRERYFSAAGEKGCSSVGVDARQDQPTLVAQNMDLPKWWDGHQVLLHVIDPASPVEALVFTVAGKISLCGVNSAGLAICCNGMSQLSFAPDGLAEDFVVRGFLARSTLDEGLAFMRMVRHASGQNYTIGAPGSVVHNLECSANQVCEYRPPHCRDRVYHTNHPLVNTDQEPWRRLGPRLSGDERRRFFHGTTYERFPALEKTFGNPSFPPTVDGIKAALSNHEGPVCRHGEIEGRYDHYTLGCLVMELAASPRLHVAPGPPCRTPFQVFSFR